MISDNFSINIASRSFSVSFQDYNTASRNRQGVSQDFFKFETKEKSNPRELITFLRLLGYKTGDTVYAFLQPSKRVYELVLTENGCTAQLTKKLEESSGFAPRELTGQLYKNGLGRLANLAQGEDPQSIFLVPNHHAGGITTGHFHRATACFYECDDASLADQEQLVNRLIEAGLVPSAIVYSGSKSLHNYFVLTDDVTKDRWVYLQKLLIAVATSDVAIKNLSRQMRAPGFPRPGKNIQSLCYTSEARYSSEELEKILLGFLPYGLSDARWTDYHAARGKKDGSHEGILNMPESQLPSVMRAKEAAARKAARPRSLSVVSTSLSDAWDAIARSAVKSDFRNLGANPADHDENRCECPLHKKGKSGTSGYFKHDKDGILRLGCNGGCGGLRTLPQVEQALRFGLGYKLQGKEFVDFTKELAAKYGVQVEVTEFTRSIVPVPVQLSIRGTGNLPLSPDPEQLATLKNQVINVTLPADLTPLEKETAASALKSYRDAGVKVQINGRDARLVDTDHLRKVSMPPSIVYQDRFLPADALSREKWKGKVAIVKSGTGTGKTEQTKLVIREANACGIPVVFLTHRRSLAGETSRRAGVKYIDERQAISGNTNTVGVIDSFHFDGAYNLPRRDNTVLILDEVEQFLIHMVDSNTDIKKHRCDILENFADLVRRSELICMDAHITDITINWIKKIKKIESSDFYYIRNDYKQSWDTYFYNGASPETLLGSFLNRVTDLAAGHLGGKKLLYLTDSQKIESRTGTKNIASLVSEREPSLRVMRIDQETIKHWNAETLLEEIKNHDVIICSPTIATGWDLNLEDAFESVWGVFNGVLTVASVRQFLARLRDLDVPRHIWVNSVGIAGGTAYTLDAVLKDLRDCLTAVILRVADNPDCLVDLDTINTYQACLDFFCGYKARDAAEKSNYRQCVLEELRKDGSLIIPVESPSDKKVSEVLTNHRDAEQQKEREQVLAADLITERKYESIKSKGPEGKELFELQKYELHSRYGINHELNLPLLEFNQEDGYRKLRNRYFLTAATAEAQITLNDTAIIEKLRRERRVFLPDVAPKLLGERTSLLKTLGVLRLTQLNKLSHSDGTCREVAELAQTHSDALRRLFGLTIHHKSKPAIICRALLDLIGFETGDACRVKSKGLTHREWEVFDATTELPVAAIFAAWDRRYLDAIAKPSIKDDKNKVLYFLSNPTSVTADVVSTKVEETGQVGDKKPVEIRTESNQLDPYTEKNGVVFPIYRSYNQKTTPEKTTPVDYKTGDRVYYFSLQRGGVWTPATVVTVNPAGLVVKMDGSILEIRVWEPKTELAPLAA